MLYQIKNRWTQEVLFECDAESLAACVVAAVVARANLYGANLDGANLDGANLYGANLYGANLDGANLTPIRDDLWAVLSSCPREVEGLRLALVEGRVDGSTYRGECACLVGTVAKLRQCEIDALGSLKPNGSRPIEMFFQGIRPGAKPGTGEGENKCAALAIEWIDEWLSNVRGAFAGAAT